ncbi:hypothetical protein G9A89_012344, partial [Geosiphon pyriformis]
IPQDLEPIVIINNNRLNLPIKRIYKDIVDVTGNIRKMEITDNIHTLAQQLFQLIQHQEMEITINQQTIRYQDTRKTLQLKTLKKTENTVNKIMMKVKLAIKESTKESLYQELTKKTWNW